MNETTRLICGRPFSARDEERFWAKCIPEPNTGCWLWTGALTTKGYGKRSRGDGRGWWFAHRVAWALLNGDVPEGLLVRHVWCRNPPCCNPSHLRTGTQRENLADMVRDGTSTKGDRNPARLHPERLDRGDRHWSRRTPARVPRGHRHWTRARPEGLARGEKNGRAKLTESDVCEIRRLYSAGATQLQLGQRFHINPGTVSGIVLRKKWAHVP